MNVTDATESGVWRIGIHGARNAGKTCYLACLYGARTDDDQGTQVGFSDDATIDYLADKWDNYLLRGEKPKPNPTGMPTDLMCQVKTDERVRRVVLRDYAGELVERKSADEVSVLRQETRDWLKSCNAILFFLDITETEQAVRERLNELDLMLDELHDLTADGNKIARPIALILTKWDDRPDFDIGLAHPAKESEKARVFLKNHVVFNQFYSALAKSANRVKIFPISAFGSHRDGHRPPAEGPQPFNIHDPLLWSVARSEEMVAEKAQRDAEDLVKKWWPQYSAAVTTLESTITQYGLSKGTAHKQLAGKIGDFCWKLWVRRFALAAFASVSIVAIAFGVLWLDEQQRYKSLAELYDDPSASPEGVKDSTDRYLERGNPWKNILRHEEEIRKRWRDMQDDASKIAFVNLRDFRRDHPLETEATARMKEDQRFLELWGTSDDAAIVEGWKMEDEAVVREYETRLTHESDFQGMLEDVAKHLKGNNYADAIEAHRSFLQKYPESTYRNDVERRIVDLENDKDEFDWKVVVDFEQKYPNSFQEAIEKAKTYLANSTAKHKKEAEALVTRTENRWDRAMYEQVCKANRTSTNADSVESTQRKATAYINGTQPRKRMTGAVKKWLEWFDGLQKDDAYKVIVRSLKIPAGSNLYESNPCCRVQVTVNGRDFKTNYQYGKNPVYKQELGPYRFKWGEKGTFSIRIEEWDADIPFQYDDVAEFPRPETDDRFIISRLNGPVAVRDRNGKDVIVYLECDDVKPPVLAPYKEK